MLSAWLVTLSFADFLMAASCFATVSVTCFCKLLFSFSVNSVFKLLSSVATPPAIEAALLFNVVAPLERVELLSESSEIPAASLAAPSVYSFNPLFKVDTPSENSPMLDFNVPTPSASSLDPSCNWLVASVRVSSRSSTSDKSLSPFA